MKLKFIPILVVALSLTSGLGAIALSATPNSFLAQESTSPQKPVTGSNNASRPTPPPPGLKGLNLSQQQQDQIKQIWSDLEPQFKAALPPPPQLTAEQEAKIQQVMQPFREKLEAVLTPEQQQQLRQNLDNSNKNPGPAVGGPIPHPPALASLNLTAQQQEQIKQLNQELRSQLRGVLPPPPQLTAEQKAKLEQLKQSYREKVEAVLHSDQKQQFRQNLEQLHQQRPHNSSQGS